MTDSGSGGGGGTVDSGMIPDGKIRNDINLQGDYLEMTEHKLPPKEPEISTERAAKSSTESKDSDDSSRGKSTTDAGRQGAQISTDTTAKPGKIKIKKITIKPVKGSSTKRKDKKKSVGKTAKQIGEITPKNEFNQNDKELKLPEPKPKSRCIIVTFGSSTLRIGRNDSDMETPLNIPCCVAFKRRNKEAEEYWDAAQPYAPIRDFGDEKFKSGKHGKYTRKRKRDETRRMIEKELQKRHKVMNGMEYTSMNCTTTMPEDKSFWTDTTGDPPVVVGEEAVKLPNPKDYFMFYPIQRGVCNVTDSTAEGVRRALYHLLRYSLQKKLQLSEDKWRLYTIVVGIPARFNLREISILLDVIFKDLCFEKAFMHNEQVLACFGAGVSSACVVDVGAQKTHICCVVDGSVIPRTEINLDYGGDDIDETLLWLLKDDDCNHFAAKHCQMDQALNKQQARNIKEKHCFYSELGTELLVQDAQFLERKAKKETRIHRFNIATAALVAPRAIFQPSLLLDLKPYYCLPPDMSSGDPWAELFLKDSGYYKYSLEAREHGFDVDIPSRKVSTPKGTGTPKGSFHGLPSPISMKYSAYGPKVEPRMPIHDAITHCISSLQSPDLKAKLAKQVLLVGGSVMFKGIVDALEEELVALIPYKIPGANTVNVILNPKKAGPENLSWKGAYILANAETIHDQLVKRKSYLEFGISALREQCPFPI